MSIFVSVVSYCDKVLGFTLDRARTTAKSPEALHFGVVEQCPADWPTVSGESLAPARLSYMRMEPVHARGPCWARAIAMSYYDNEDWFFQIDAHTDFDEGWDERLIGHAISLSAGRQGVAISSYPNPFVFEGTVATRRPRPPDVLAHVVKVDTKFSVDHSILGFAAHPVAIDHPIQGFHVGAGCLFSLGRFAQTFPYDPHFYFHGEEQAIAARLFTHGWDIFHVPALPIYHLYNNIQSGPARTMHWDAAEEKKRSLKWRELEKRSRLRLDRLLRGEDLGVYGLGCVRTIGDYAAFCGIDYAQRTLSQQAFRPLAPSCRAL